MTPRTPSALLTTHREQVMAVLRRERPSRWVYAPNYWQWFAHQRNHGLLPPELQDCSSQLDLIRYLGLDVFSRNVYCDETNYWFGGLAAEAFNGIEVEVNRRIENRDVVSDKTYRTRAGILTERLRYVFSESSLVQEKYLLSAEQPQLEAFAELVQARSWHFDSARFEQLQQELGEDGVMCAGELFSPLKLFHLAAGQAGAVFLLEDFPERCREIMAVHERAQLALVRQMATAGVPAMMAMDNLDAMFHTPRYIELYSAGFYEQAARLCRESGSAFFIHACGRQRAILPLVASLQVDGLEGVAFPPLGDVQLEKAMQLTGDRLILTGGISAFETEHFKSQDEVHRYLENLFDRLRPYAHRFILSASCNTSIITPWRVLTWFRDAWRQLTN